MNRYGVEVRAEVTGNKLAGHAAVWDQMARIGPSWERINRGAFDEALKRGDDVAALVNHNPMAVLGRRSAGTLRLATDSTGLQFEVDLPQETEPRNLRELVARRDVHGASFGFIPGEFELGTAPDGRQLRSHTSVARLLDISVVTYPAYDGTDVQLRTVTFAKYDPGRDPRARLIRARVALLSEGTEPWQ